MKNGNRASMVRKVLAFGLLFAAAASVAHAEGGAGRLPGTWEITLTVLDCATGQPRATIRELATFNRGGTMISSTAGLAPVVNPLLKTPGHGVWRHVAGPNYEYRFKFFRFDATGTFVGWTVVHQELVLDATGAEYAAGGGAESYNAAGTLISIGCSTTEATRFE